MGCCEKAAISGAPCKVRGDCPYPVAQMRFVQRSAKRGSPCLVNFVPTVVYHFCPTLPATFTQPGDHLLAEPVFGTGS